MNTVLKAGIAGAVALGFGAAHAAVVVPVVGTTTNSDYVLFAEVVSGTTVVGSYAGDSGIAATTTLTAGTVGGLSTASDAALASLISVGTAAGNTIEWALQGGSWAVSGTTNATDVYYTTVGTGTALANFNTRTGGNLSNWSVGLINTLTTVASNAGSSNSVYATTTAKGGVWDATVIGTNVQNWYNNGGATANLYGTNDTLYSVSAAGTTSPAVLTSAGFVSLTSAGLVFSTGATAVPLPAAIWLLGSGLLGLAGVGRRKSATV